MVNEKRISNISVINKLLFGIMFVFCGIFARGNMVNADVAVYDYKVTDAEKAKVDPTDTESDIVGIQSILDKAIGSPKMITIYFPAGVYYVDNPLLVYSNTHIILDANATVYRMDPDKNLLHNVDQNCKMDVVGGYDMSSNIILEGGTWDGGNTQLANKGTDVLRIDHAKDVIIKDCVIKNSYDCHMLELIGVQNGTVSGCTFTGFCYKRGKETDYTYAREAIQIETAWTSNEADLSDINSAWAKGSVIDGTPCKQILITNNKFIDIPCGAGQHRYTKSGKYRNQDVTISNNEFTCSDSMKACKIAVTCSGTNNLTVTGNVITGPYRFAAQVLASDNVIIDSNQISGISMNGIMVDMGAITSIKDNVIKNIGKHGISVGGGSVKDISNNSISQTKQSGISVDDGTIDAISNNIIDSPGKHGITISKTAANKSKGGNVKSVSGNTISKAKQNGICVDTGKVADISSNTIKNSGKHGISVVGGTVGSGKKKNVGIKGNTITTCKQNCITVSGKGVVSAVLNNKISGAKNNGISITEKAKVYWVTGNTIKKCKKHGIWSDFKTAKIKGNKGQKE